MTEIFRKTMRISSGPVLASLLLAAAVPPATAADVVRRDFHVSTVDDVRIHVREVAVPGDRDGAPLVLVHGARVPGVASFDLPVSGGSLAADLAERSGRPVYVMDARGYGGSERPAAMSRPPEASRPLARAHEVVRDIDAVVDAVGRDGEPVALLGWATGGMWMAFHASLHPRKVSHLVTLNALYGGSGEHGMLGADSSSADPANPARFNPDIGGYAFSTAASLFGGWNRSIPLQDKDAWRDPAVAAAYAEAALASDPESGRRDPPAFRHPKGAIEDSFYQAAGRRLFDASSITARVLLVHAGRDFWSRPEDIAAFAHDAVHSRGVRVLELPEATHFVHLDRAERGRRQLIDAIVGFLAEGDDGSAAAREPAH